MEVSPGMSNRVSKNMVVICLLLWACSAVAGESNSRILFDQGHNQRFLIEEKGELQLSQFAEIIRGQGSSVVSTKTPLNDDALKDISALVISGPFESLRPEEVESIVRFVERGGRLAAMLHIGRPLGGLLGRLGLDHSNYVLHERQNVINEDINFRVTALSDSPLFAGLTQFSAYGCWALDPGKSGTSIARTSPDAWVDLNGDKILSKGDVSQVFTVAVSGMLGAGGFVAFGDDAIFQNRNLDENNSRLATNLAGWLAGR
jgi:hypothetical protein